MTTLREAATALVDKIPVCEEAARGVYTLAYVHGLAYTGPTYEAELNALRAALAAPPPGMEEIERRLGDVLPPVRRMARRIDEPWSTQEEAIAIDAADEADLHGLRTARAMLLTAIGDALAQARREGIEAAAAHADLFVELQSNAENGDVAEQVAASIRRALGAAP